MVDGISNVRRIPAAVVIEEKVRKESADHLSKQQDLEPSTYLGDDHAKHDGEQFFNAVGKNIHRRDNHELLRVKQDQLTEDIAADHASKYLSSGEIESLGSYVKNFKQITTAADILLKRLARDGTQSVELIINFLMAAKLTIAESYIILNYMYETQKRKKNSLKETLGHLLIKLEQQESAYLFNFFAISKNPLLNNHPEILESVVRLNTGQINLEGLKETIQYIREKNLDVAELVSGYVKYHLKIIEKLQLAVSSFEERSMIAQFIGMEQKFIKVYSIFLKVRDFIQKFFTSAKVPENLNYNSLLLSLFNFAEVAEISSLAINTLLKSFPAEKKNNQVGFLNHIIQLYDALPQEIFASDKTRQSFFEGIRAYISKNDPQKQKLLNHKPFDYFRMVR